jgi:hypothetical protein
MLSHFSTESVARSEAFNIDYLLQGTSDAQFRQCACGLNSMAWLFWHMARVEDAFVSCIVLGREQLFDQEGWSDRLEVSEIGVGTGMTKADVANVSAQINLPALWGYRDAVGRRTRIMVKEIPSELWFDPIDVDDIRQAALTGIISAEAASVMSEYLLQRSRESALFWWGLNHSLMHLGQVNAIHKLVQVETD